MPILETRKLTKMLNLDYLQTKSSELNQKLAKSTHSNENINRVFTDRQDDKSSVQSAQDMLSDS